MAEGGIWRDVARKYVKYQIQISFSLNLSRQAKTKADSGGEKHILN
jgi:hypothetical protein